MFISGIGITVCSNSMLAYYADWRLHDASVQTGVFMVKTGVCVSAVVCVLIGIRADWRLWQILPNRCRPLRGWKTRPEKERRGRPNRHHSIPAPRERGLIQPFFR